MHFNHIKNIDKKKPITKISYVNFSSIFELKRNRNSKIRFIFIASEKKRNIFPKDRKNEIEEEDVCFYKVEMKNRKNIFMIIILCVLFEDYRNFE